MKHIFTLLALVFVTNFSFSQTEKDISIKVGAQFDNLFNAGEFESIFEMFSPEMKAALPHDQAITLFTTLRTQAGKLKSREFIKYERGLVALYKTQFERAVFALNLSVDQKEKINGILVKPYQEESVSQMDRNTTKMILPFNEEWTVFWGGDTEELNYHVATPAQKNAFDLVITDDSGKSYQGDGLKNEDYYAFGKELIAPAAGEIVLVVDGIKDNRPGTMNPSFVPGNTVILKTDNDEYLLFAHFKQHSIQVKQGQRVNQGDLLGLSGNSGNSTEPHLHFHIQNIEDMNVATGVKTFFDKIKVNGASRSDYSPIRGDKIKNY